MSDNENAGSSLLRTQHHIAQREQQKRQSHQRLHRALHKRKEVAAADTVTEIVATISIIQQISVDQNGNTIGIETIQTHLTPNVQPPALITNAPQQTAPVIAEPLPSPAPPSIPQEPALPPSNPPPPPAPSPTEPSQNPPIVTQPPYSESPPVEPQPSEVLPPSPSPPSAAPSVATTPELETPILDGSANITTSSLDATAFTTSAPTQTTTFPSFIPSLNSTSLFKILNATQTYSNSSRLSTSSTSTLSRSRTLLSSSETISPISTSLLFAAPTEGGVIAGGTGVANGLTPENTAQATVNDTADNGLPPTPVVVGGVIGSIAGAAVLIVAVLYFIRWRKRNRGMITLGGGSIAGRDDHEEHGGGGMTERSTGGFAIPASFAAIANKRFSRNREPTEPAAASGEKGFYRVSGRKLPSVLQSGGDGYGGGPVINNDEPFYRDSHAFFGGRGPPSPPLGSINRQSTGGVPIFRPSPARTPTREENPFIFPGEDAPSPPRIPDHVGRSHASADGSHASRFVEEV